MKTVSLLLVGAIAGWLLLWQIQTVASENAMECLSHYQPSQHKQFCKNDVVWMEFVFNVSKKENK